MLLLKDFLTIDVIFSLINFGIIVVFFIFIFKRFVFPRVKRALAQEKKQQQELIQQGELLTQRIKKVHEEQDQQELVYRTLYERVLTWKKAVADEQEQQIIVYNHIRALLEAKRHKQLEHTMFERIRRVVIDDALQQARQDLMIRFRDARQSERYIQQVIAHIKDIR